MLEGMFSAIASYLITILYFFTSEELSAAKMTFNAYSHQINEMEQQLKDNEQELKVLVVKNENAKVAEEMQAAKVCVQACRIVSLCRSNLKIKNSLQLSDILYHLNWRFPDHRIT